MISVRRAVPYILLLPIYLILAFYTYWAFDSYFIPYERHEHVTLENADSYAYDRNGTVIINHNDTITISYYVERYKTCKVTSVRIAHNISTNTDYSLSSEVILFKPEPDHKIIRYSLLPEHLPAGPYLLKVLLSRECNPLETLFPITTEIKILPFVIVNKPR